MGTRTHFTLFVPGTSTNLAEWQRRLASTGVEVTDSELRSPALPFSVSLECVANDGTFGRAFSFGTVSAAEQTAIGRAPTALVLGFPVDLHAQRAAVAGIARQLQEAGALAIRVEQSRLGWPIRTWIELVDGIAPSSLYRAVVIVLSEPGDALVQTCGMHAFSLPDAAVDPEGDERGANELLTALCLYEIAEDPLLLPGQTFAADPDSPRRVLERWPDGRYPASDPCHNPFGVLRLGPPDGEGRRPGELALTFIPSLVALLLAAEEQKGRPLEKTEVEEITSNGACIAMKHEDARKLERERGYADLDPEQSWAQWCVARRVLGEG